MLNNLDNTTGRAGWLNCKCSEVKPAISAALPFLRSAITLLTNICVDCIAFKVQYSITIQLCTKTWNLYYMLFMIIQWVFYLYLTLHAPNIMLDTFRNRLKTFLFTCNICCIVWSCDILVHLVIIVIIIRVTVIVVVTVTATMTTTTTIIIITNSTGLKFISNMGREAHYPSFEWQSWECLPLPASVGSNPMI